MAKVPKIDKEKKDFRFFRRRMNDEISYVLLEENCNRENDCVTEKDDDRIVIYL